MALDSARSQTPPPTDGAIRQILRQRIDEQKHGVGIAVGWVDEHGARVVGCGQTKREGGNAVDGKTMFEIGSVSKVFTSLLLALAVERGEVKLDDPVQKYLPPEVKMPTRNGRQITLLDLATHRSGLPRLPDNMTRKDAADPYADYTLNQMYTFLSGYTLKRDIGAAFEYSNLGVGLLGNVLAWRAGATYESLLRERICQPLGMNDTSITLTSDQQGRLALPYKEDLTPAKNWNLPAFAGAGAIRSDADDMLRFLAAELGLVPSSLSSAIKRTQQSRKSAGAPNAQIGLGWFLDKQPDPLVLWHNGATAGYRSWVGLDPAQRRGVVVLSNTANGVDNLGFRLLRPPASPKSHVATAIKAETGELYVGRYQLVPTFVLTFSREGDRYYVQATGQGRNEVFPETDTNFFLKVVDAQISFVRDDSGKVASLILHQNGRDQTAVRLP